MYCIMNFRKVILLFFILTSVVVHAQTQKQEVLHYILPEFKNGTVLMKNGTENQALLNYNAATEEMVFDQNGQKLALADATLLQVDTVFIEDRVFVLTDDKKFAEIIGLDDYKLLVQYKCRITPPGSPAAYGGTSQTSSATSFSSWMGDGRVYELELPNDFKINPYMVYWIDNGSGLESFTSMRQIRRFYNKQRALYNKYTNENKVDFDDKESIAALIHHLETAK